MRDVEEVQELLAEILEKPDHQARAGLIHAIARESIPGRRQLLGNQILAVGLSADGWTVGSRCAGVALINDDDREMVWQLLLGCTASADQLPLVAVVDDGAHQEQIEFERAGSHRVDLPAVPGNSERLVIIGTDKSWTPRTEDSRRLGVSVKVTPTGTLEALLKHPDAGKRSRLSEEIATGSFAGKRRLLGDRIVAAGLSPDHWTEEGTPAGLVYTNSEAREVSPELLISCDAPAEDLPVTLTIENGRRNTKRKRTYVFRKTGTKKLALPPVAPHSKHLFIVNTDKFWSAGRGNPRRLGVRVEISPDAILRSLQEKPDARSRVELAEVIANEPLTGKLELLSGSFVAVGLTADHWTSGSAPAAVVVDNRHERELAPELALSCHARSQTLPLTVTFDDGENLRRVVCEEPRTQDVALTAVPRHARRLYIISTDKTWSPGRGDRRKLGVHVDVSAAGMLSILELEGPRDPKLWGEVTRALASREVPGGMELDDPRVMAFGSSPDRWLLDARPAGVLISNPGDHETVWELELGCYADPEAMPLTAHVDDGERRSEVKFLEAGDRRVILSPVPPGSKRLYVISCDETWSPGEEDPRKLGVLLRSTTRSISGTLASLLESPHGESRAWVLKAILDRDGPGKQLLDNGRITAVGLTHDLWTTNEGPAGLVIVNEAEQELKLELHLACHARRESLPITAFVASRGEERRVCRFDVAGTQTLALPVVPPRGKHLVIIGTDRTWSPGTQEDQRRLGVHVELES